MQDKIETRENLESNPKEVVVAWINKTFSSDASRQVKDKFLSALEQDDKEKIKKLSEALENHLDYIRPKYRDTADDKQYIKQLEDGLLYLKRLL